MSENQEQAPAGPEGATPETAGSILRRARDAESRIDSGTGNPEDVTIAMRALVDYSVLRLTELPDFKNNLLDNALEYRRRLEGGPFRQMVHYSEKIASYYDRALYYSKQDPKEAADNVRKAGNWQKVLDIIRNQQATQQGNQ